MAIPLKSIKSGFQAKQTPRPAAEPASGAQPIVIDFPFRRSRQIAANFTYALFGALAAFVLMGILMLFILRGQIDQLWNKTPQPVAQHVNIVKTETPAPEPETAFPATTITPLPSKAFIIGKDFQKTKSGNKLELEPLLEKLPVYAQPAKPARSHSSYVEVETMPILSQSARLQQQADDAVVSGQTTKAIELYQRALRLSPNDASLRANCVALLLEQARSYDEQGDALPAIVAYKKAQGLWQGDAQTAQRIKARIEFLEQN